MSGRCVKASRTQWLTTTTASTAPVRTPAFRSAMYAPPNTSAHAAAAIRLCEKG